MTFAADKVVMSGKSAARRFAISDDLFFDLTLLFIPVLAAFNIEFMGQILVSDFFIPLLTVVIVLVRGIPPSRIVYLTLGAAALWVMALVLSDMLNDSLPANYLRGWARNGLACCYLVYFLCALRPTMRSMAMVVLGLVSSLIIAYSGIASNFGSFVKFGGGMTGTWVLCLAAMWGWRSRKPLLSMFAIFVWMLVALSQNVRSVMTVDFIVLALCVLSYYFHTQLRKVSVPVMLVILLVAGGGSGAVLATTYGYVADSGALGPSAQTKFRRQSRGSNLASIWNARPELRVASAVIAQSPLLGHGSWYHDEKITAAELLFSSYAEAENPTAIAQDIVKRGGVESMGHSTILQSWVEAGIVGAAFWAWVIIVCLAAIARSLRYPTIMAPLVFIAATDLIWETLFSPFGNTARMVDMAGLALVLISLTFKTHSEPKKHTA